VYRTIKQLIKDYLGYFNIAILAGYYRFKNAGNGRAMGLFWEFARPLVFSLAMGVGISVGFRQARNDEGPFSYLEWLFAGYFAWNVMGGTFSWGPKVFASLKRLVHQRIVPLTLLPVVKLVKPMIVFITFLCVTCIIGMFFGKGPFLAWLQLPFILALMVIYWYFFVFLVASLGTLSKDFAMFIAVLKQPLFWTSGIIINVANIESTVFKAYLAINPISFFVTSFRRVVHDGEWIFTDTNLCFPFVVVFFVTVVLACVMYHKLKLEIRNEIR
jgi:ABC-type polysaccharide/polyol phosphate export permease